jgi:pyruvate/2-oxoglutarate dehydrogenase complex dihydrolipoamide dehydrogenase (E3) component
VEHRGFTEEQARQRYGDKVRMSFLRMAQVNRAVIEDSAEGFMKIVQRRNGAAIGATIVGQRAAATLWTWPLAGDNCFNMGYVARTMQAYPSLRPGISSRRGRHIRTG